MPTEAETSPANTRLVHGLLTELFDQAPPARSNYLTNISKRHRYVYVETPKVACSTIKRTLQSMELEGTDQSLPSDIHSRESSPLIAPISMAEELADVFASSDYWKFCFIRNPYTRILSCYLDKFVINQYERQKRLPKLGFEIDEHPSFEEFLERVAKQNVDEMDIHWCPQTALLALDTIDYDFIGRFESFERDFNLALRRIASALESPPTIITADSHRVSASGSLSEHLTPRAGELILRVYRNDFERLLYSKDPRMSMKPS